MTAHVYRIDALCLHSIWMLGPYCILLWILLNSITLSVIPMIKLASRRTTCTIIIDNQVDLIFQVCIYRILMNAATCATVAKWYCYNWKRLWYYFVTLFEMGSLSNSPGDLSNYVQCGISALHVLLSSKWFGKSFEAHKHNLLVWWSYCNANYWNFATALLHCILGILLRGGLERTNLVSARSNCHQFFGGRLSAQPVLVWPGNLVAWCFAVLAASDGAKLTRSPAYIATQCDVDFIVFSGHVLSFQSTSIECHRCYYPSAIPLYYLHWFGWLGADWARHRGARTFWCFADYADADDVCFVHSHLHHRFVTGQNVGVPPWWLWEKVCQPWKCTQWKSPIRPP